jgi:hypothetical protein
MAGNLLKLASVCRIARTGMAQAFDLKNWRYVCWPSFSITSDLTKASATSKFYLVADSMPPVDQTKDRFTYALRAHGTSNWWWRAISISAYFPALRFDWISG